MTTNMMIATPMPVYLVVVIAVVAVVATTVTTTVIVSAFEILKDINPGRPSSYPNDFIHLTTKSSSCGKQQQQQQGGGDNKDDQHDQDLVLFFVEDVDYGNNQAGPWITDGTTDGTINVTASRLKEAAPKMASNNNMNPNAIVMTNDGKL